MIGYVIFFIVLFLIWRKFDSHATFHLWKAVTVLLRFSALMIVTLTKGRL